MCTYVLWNDAPVVRGIMHRLVRNIHAKILKRYARYELLVIDD